MIILKYLLVWNCVYQSITTLINLGHQNKGPAPVVATNLKQKESA
jgi:hypothetical protein